MGLTPASSETPAVTQLAQAASVTVGAGNAEIAFYGSPPAARPEIPAAPNAQDVADAIVALGLASQAA